MCTPVCYGGIVANLHVVAIPMLECHIVLNIFNMVTKFLGVLCNNWRAKFIGMSLNGKNIVTGCHARFVTRIVACAKNNMLHLMSASLY